MKIACILWVTSLGLMIPMSAQAEGIASQTFITTQNHKNLGHHKLKVALNPARGMTSVMLYVEAEKATPFLTCSVEIRKDTGKQPPARLANFEIPVGSRPVHFSIADELVDQTRIQYLLHANEFQCHMFIIEPSQLRKLARVDTIEL